MNTIRLLPLFLIFCSPAFAIGPEPSGESGAKSPAENVREIIDTPVHLWHSDRSERGCWIKKENAMLFGPGKKRNGADAALDQLDRWETSKTVISFDPAPQKAHQSKPELKAAQPPPAKQVLFSAVKLTINGRPAFIMKSPKSMAGKPWVFYAATLPAYPDKAESWMHQSFLAKGISIAGIDVGEAYGSPKAFPQFEALYQKMVGMGYSTKPVLLGRSRGGLWVSSWAIKHPDRVKAIAGIYPAYDFTTYPGLKRAAPAYGLSPDELKSQPTALNPIEKMDVLAKAKIPVHIIHGIDDQVIPIAENSDRLQSIYQKNGAGDLMTLNRIKAQGHSFWPGFFRSQDLVDFVIKEASPARDR